MMSACASNAQKIPIVTAWKNVDLSETNIQKSIKQLQESLNSAAKDMNITNCGDLSNAQSRQKFLTSLQAMKSLNPALASAALLAKTQVLGSIQDVRRAAGELQIAMTQLVNALPPEQFNPQNPEQERLNRINVEAKGASGLINYAEQIADQLQRLGG
ncbi:MAG: hypothetical protein EXS12_01990 [Phycisphaerales bacterium]|nr:hypothetical protein [Phycisphaerales bacterium]